MSLLIGDRTRWHLINLGTYEPQFTAPSTKREPKLPIPTGARGTIFVRPAVRRLLIDDNPIADLLDRICDEIDRRAQSRRERLQSPFRRWLDYRVIRWLYRAQKAGKLRLPRIYWRHVGLRLLAKFNRQIDRWFFDPEGNPAIDRIAYALCAFTALYLLAQLVRAWR